MLLGRLKRDDREANITFTRAELKRLAQSTWNWTVLETDTVGVLS